MLSRPKTQSIAAPASIRSLQRIIPALLATVALVLLGAVAPASAAAETSLAGTVYGPPDGTGYPPLAGATVTVHAAEDEGSVAATVTTSPSGAYLVTGLAPGDYKLRFAGDAALHQPQWYGGPTFASAAVITITPDSQLTSYDAYLLDATTSVAGTVYGPWTESGYPPLAGATVTVHAAENQGTVVATVTTSAGGEYLADDLAPGDYKLHFAGDAALHQPQWYGGGTFATAAVITIAPGTHLLSYDAYLLDATTSVAGTVYAPWDEAGYPPLAGATVTVHAADDEGDVIATTTTSATGTYGVTELAPGDYKLRFAGDPSLHQPQWYGGSTFATASVITIAPGTHLTFYDAYLLDATTSITGTVYGPAGEGAYEPLAGATVTVHAADNEATVVATATTTGAGTYIAAGLAPGDYKLRFTGTAGVHEPQWYGGATFAAASVITIAPGTHLTFYDAYLLDATMSVAGTVRGPDGLGLPGAAIEAFAVGDLESAAADAISQADGTYLIADLEPGDYLVRFTGDEAYAVQWYFASTSAENATPLTLAAGTHLTGIDATLAAPGHEWLTVPTPTITGSATAGGTLTAQPGTWDPVPTSFTYQWSVDGEEVAGATSSTFVVPVSAKGSQVTVTVTAHKAGFPNQSAFSESTTIAGWSAAEIAAAMNLPAGITLSVTGSTGGVAVATEPIIGFPREGGSFAVLSTGLAKDAAVAGEPSQHLSSSLDGPNGVDGNDLSQLTLQVTSPPAGAQCVVMDLRFGTEEFPEYVNKGFNDLFTMESPTSSITVTPDGVLAPNNYAFDVDGDIISVDTAGLIEIPGTALDGVTPILVAAAPIPAAADGRIIITIQDRGDSILDSVVFLDKVRFGSGDVCDSNVAAPVDPIVGVTPTISGTVEQGATLTAVTGTWTPAPVDLAFQWLRDGSPIPGATGSTYVVSGADEGSRISVRVTGSKPGYLSVVKVSAETVVVPGSVSGSITGLVVDTDGSPAAGVDVCLRMLDGGSPVTVDIGALGADGRYTFSAVPAGTYHLLFITSSPTCNASQTSSAPYEPQYYRFQSAWASAAPIVVGVGSEDLELETVVLTAYGAGTAKELHAHGIPTITGTAQIGQVLTAGAASWYPAPTAVVRQWFAGGAPISGATGETYTVTAAEAGKTITVRETGSGPDLVTTAATSAATAVVPFGTLTAPTPTITGTAKVGVTLTAVPGTWGPAPVTLAYQWNAGGAPVAGATSSTFTPSAAEAGKTVTVTVTGSKAGYITTPKTSTATSAVAAGTLTAPAPTITGTTQVGAMLTAVPGTWGPAPVTLAYLWKAGGVAISGATASTFVLTSAQLGKTITVTVTGSKTGYTTTAKTSTATAAVTAPTLSAPTPTITGTAKVGRTLTAAPGTWGPAPVTLAYQWKAGGVAISGATASTFVLTSAQLGKTITVTVTGSKSGYPSASRTSAATAAVAVGTLTAPTPTITGTAKVGVKLTAVPGTWGPSPVTLKYQWKANGAAVSGATASTFLVPASLLGKTITVTVTGSKTAYATASKTSAATLAVAKGTLTAPTPKITGTAKVGVKLTAVPGTWGPSPVTLKYQWKADGVAISGATASTYVVAAGLVGKKITVTVTGSKTAYTTASKTSVATLAVVKGTLTAPTPTVTGTARVGLKLTALPGTWGPAPVTLKYQWKANGTAISGATGSTLVIPASAKGKKITVTVTGSKTGYTTVSKTSAASATVG